MGWICTNCLCNISPSYSIYDLSYTHLLLSLYLYMANFSFIWHIHSPPATYSLSVVQISAPLWGKLFFFTFLTSSFTQLLIVSSHFSGFPLPFQQQILITTSSRWFINFYIVIRSLLSHLSLISSCTNLVVSLWILFIFFTYFFMHGALATSA